MNFELSDEQLTLQQTARKFIQQSCPPSTAKEWDETYTYPEKFLRDIAAMGWNSIAFPEEEGGGGGGPIELTILAEELGRASFDVAMCFIVNLIATATLAKFATDEQRATLLPDFTSGRRRMSISISEPDAGSDVKALSLRAEDKGDHLVLTGQKMWCTGAGLPNTVIGMYVRTQGHRGDRSGISLLMVDPSSEGVELRQIPTLARHVMGTYEVYLDGVVIPKSSLIGQLHNGWDVLMSSLEIERVLLSGGYVGAAQATVDEALNYAKQRRQFDNRIGDFQAIAHTLANLQTEVDAARLLAYRAAWLLASGRPCSREGSMAKLFGSETYVRAAREGMQVWGGYGFSTESVMSFRYRESIVTTISGGTSQIQRNGIARSMGLKP